MKRNRPNRKLQPSREKQDLGNRGEADAQALLEKKGYRFLDRNFDTPWGELDLIMLAPDQTVVFVEVKAQIRGALDSPLEHIDDRKLSHLVRAALVYLQKRGWEDRTSRFDAVGITYDVSVQDQIPTVVSIEFVQDLTGW